MENKRHLLKQELHKRLHGKNMNKRQLKLLRGQNSEELDKIKLCRKQAEQEEEKLREIQRKIALLDEEEKQLQEERDLNQREFKKEHDRLTQANNKLKKAVLKRENEEKFQERSRPKPSSQNYNPRFLATHLKPCATMLKTITENENAWVFLDDVDPSRYPDYLEVIARPMCLNTVEHNLYNGHYTNIHQFGKDMKQIWLNAMHYNPGEHQVHQWAKVLSQRFELMFARAIQGLDPQEESKKMATSKLTPQEMVNLQEKIEYLSASQLVQVQNLVRGHANSTSANGEEYELDLDALPIGVLRQLQELVRKPKNSRRAQRQRIVRQIDSLQNAPTSGFGIPPPSGFGMPPPSSFGIPPPNF